MSSQKSSDTVDRRRRVDILPAQIAENLHVQWPVMPLVPFIQIDCDLHCHRIWHFTRDLLQKSAIPAARCRKAPNPRIDPTCANVRAGSLRTAFPASSERFRMPDCAESATQKSCAA